MVLATEYGLTGDALRTYAQHIGIEDASPPITEVARPSPSVIDTALVALWCFFDRK
jgi:hypothetical protein